MEKEEIKRLRFCSRCGSEWCELGRVLKYGKYYPSFIVKMKDGEIKKYPEDFEIVEAVCKKCAIDLYDYKHKNEVGEICPHRNIMRKSCQFCNWCFCDYCNFDICTYCGRLN